MRAFWGECIWDVEYKSKYPDLVTFLSWVRSRDQKDRVRKV